jgi:uncharacterized protein YgbK (DUF1537 family)
MRACGRPLVVLDDDPTGTQALRDVPVFLEWDDPGPLAAALAAGGTVDLMTNTRAMPPSAAEAVTRGAAVAGRAASADARVLLRGDSTLRGHVLEEYRAVRDVAFGGRTPVLLLVPALPAAGRVTLGGVQWVESGGERVPACETEYAGDASFGYRSARLLDWAEERSDGFFASARGTEVPIGSVRGDGPGAVAEALAAAAGGEPAACVPDAETVADLEVIARGLERAERAGVEIVVRCAPTFVGVLGGNLAGDAVAVPRAGDGLLVVCGSYVSRSRRQLDRLCSARGVAAVTVDPAALCGEGRDAEVARAAAAVAAELERAGPAVLATPPGAPAGADPLRAGALVASGLAHVVRALPRLPATVVVKGGITSAVTLREGLGTSRALACGPLVPGVALWRVEARGRPTDYVVVPGNVGGDDLLAELAGLLAPGGA